MKEVSEVSPTFPLSCCRRLILGDNQPDYSQSKSNQPWLSLAIYQLQMLTFGLLILPLVVCLAQWNCVVTKLVCFISPDFYCLSWDCVLINTIWLISAFSLTVTWSHTHTHSVIQHNFPQWVKVPEMNVLISLIWVPWVACIMAAGIKAIRATGWKSYEWTNYLLN